MRLAGPHLLFALLALVANDLSRSRARACAEPDAATLWAAIPESDRDGVALGAEGIGEPRVLAVELDGAPPAEAVLAIDVLLGDLHDDPAQSLVWVLGCREGRWRRLGRVSLAIDRSWDGTIDDRPGVQSIRADTVPGVARPLLRVEQVDVRGGYDPRYVRRRFVLLSLVEDRVVVALDTVVREDTTIGPDRADGPSTRRYVVYRRGSIRIRVVETSPSGRRRTLCRTDLRFDGARFVPDDPSCLGR